jgi:YggT family protein
MLLLANVLAGLAEVIGWVLFMYQWILIARMIISWVSADPRNPIVSFIYAATEPPMRFIRRRLPTSLRYFPLDMAFLVLFGLVIFARYGVVQSLVDYAAVLRARALISGWHGQVPFA